MIYAVCKWGQLPEMWSSALAVKTQLRSNEQKSDDPLMNKSKHTQETFTYNNNLPW